MDLSGVPTQTQDEIFARLPDLLTAVRDLRLIEAMSRKNLTAVAYRLGELKGDNSLSEVARRQVRTAVRYIIDMI